MFQKIKTDTELINSVSNEKSSSLDDETKKKIHLISEAFHGFTASCIYSLDRFQKLDWKIDSQRIYDLFFDYCMEIPEYRKIFMANDNQRFSYQSLYFEFFNHSYEFFIFAEAINKKLFNNKYKIIPLDFSADDKIFKRRMEYFDKNLDDINQKRTYLKLTCFAVEIIKNDNTN